MYIYKFLTHRLPHIVSVEGHDSNALTSLAMGAAAQNLLHGSSTKWNFLTVAHLYKTGTYWCSSCIRIKYLHIKDMETMIKIHKWSRPFLIKINSPNLENYSITQLLTIQNAYFLAIPGWKGNISVSSIVRHGQHPSSGHWGRDWWFRDKSIAAD